MSPSGADPRHRLARLRLCNQRLAGAPPGAAPLRTAADVVAWMGAVQAQEYRFARWSAGQRASGVLDEATVEAELARGDIVRTHVMRDTWHFVTRSDARWLLRLTGPRIQARNRHGPATVKDFTWWSYLTVADARRRIEQAGDALESSSTSASWLAQ